MSPLKKLGKMQKPPQVYGRCSEGAERSPEGTKKEKSREGEGKGSVIFLMIGSMVHKTRSDLAQPLSA